RGGTMALDAVLGEDGADVAVELDALGDGDEGFAFLLILRGDAAEEGERGQKAAETRFQVHRCSAAPSPLIPSLYLPVPISTVPASARRRFPSFPSWQNPGSPAGKMYRLGGRVLW